jgi:hypothetical protein
LSETLAFESAAAESEYQAPSPHFSEYEEEKREEENKQWGNELTAIVGANADVIVRCPWMGGAEVTLSEAMRAFNWPPNLKAEDEPFLISVVEGLLANRVIETEEPEDKEESEEDQPQEEKTESKEKPVESKPKPREQKEEKSKDPEPDKNPTIEATESKVAKVAEPQIRVQENIERPAPVAKAEITVEPAETPAPPPAKAREVNLPADETTGERPSAVIEILQTSERPLADDSKMELPRPAGQQPVSKVTSETAPLTAASVQEAIPETVTAPPEHEAEPPETNFSIGADEPPERTEVLVAVSEDDTIPEITAPVRAESLEEVDRIQFEEAESDFELSADGINLEEPIEGLILIDQREEVRSEAESTFETTEVIDESEPAEASALSFEESPPVEYETEALELEQPASQAAAAAEIEAVITELTEKIGTYKPEAAKELQAILQEAIDTPVQLEGTGIEITVEQFEAELEELIWELAEKWEIELEPEAVESLVRRIVRMKIPDETGGLNQSRIGTVQDYGTHELLKGLLIGSDTNQKAQTYASDLGSSALRLYTARLAA